MVLLKFIPSEFQFNNIRKDLKTAIKLEILFLVKKCRSCLYLWEVEIDVCEHGNLFLMPI